MPKVIGKGSDRFPESRYLEKGSFHNLREPSVETFWTGRYFLLRGQKFRKSYQENDYYEHRRIWSPVERLAEIAQE